MEHPRYWIQQFFTQEQLETLARRATPEFLAVARKTWLQLLAVSLQYSNQDPASPEVQALADRYVELIQAFTNGDPGLLASLGNLYANMGQAPPEFQHEMRQYQGIQDLVAQALAVRKA